MRLRFSRLRKLGLMGLVLVSSMGMGSQCGLSPQAFFELSQAGVDGARLSATMWLRPSSSVIASCASLEACGY